MNDNAAADNNPYRLASRQVSWWSVREWVRQRLTEHWPMAGTPAWCELADDDPVKLAAVLDAAQHWALRVETCQAAQKAASQDISASQRWSRIAQQSRNRAEHYIPRAAS